MRILVVEDEKKIASFIERGLKEEHYAVDVCRDGKEGFYRAQANPYDLVILDIMLPGLDGVSICRQLREAKYSVPILMLTAKDTLTDKVMGLNAGADDYLTKPFAFEEFLARVRALLRRKSSAPSPVLKVRDLTLDRVHHRVSRGEKVIELTGKEFALLEYLMLHVNQVVTRTMISEHVWNEGFDSFTNVIDVYITYLRRKIDQHGSGRLIHTIRGVGYTIKG